MENSTGCPKKTLLLSGSEFFTLGEVLLGVVFLQKLTGVGHVPYMCPSHEKHVFWHIKDVSTAKNSSVTKEDQAWHFGIHTLL